MDPELILEHFSVKKEASKICKVFSVQRSETLLPSRRLAPYRNVTGKFYEIGRADGPSLS